MVLVKSPGAILNVATFAAAQRVEDRMSGVILPLHHKVRRELFLQGIIDGSHSQVLSLCGCSSMVELQPSKLNTWVRFPSPAPDLVCMGATMINWARLMGHI